MYGFIPQKAMGYGSKIFTNHLGSSKSYRVWVKRVSTVFDFSKTLWRTLYSKTVLCLFDKEWEAYKCLDLDALGEPDDKLVDADDITKDILIG